MTSAEEAFPSALDCWTAEDWHDYRRRVEDGEGSVSAMEAITRRRTRETKAGTGEQR
ncbi:hypothetical protein ACFV1X_37415 [Streptomyces coelicoflavus]|uniref:hypothetical protein n=1 Tax=Streptomyces coelicoflavus TaxID=285562 RepID=UPI00367B7FB1